MSNKSQSDFRKEIISKKQIKLIIDFGARKIFENASTYTAIVLLNKSNRNKTFVFQNKGLSSNFTSVEEYSNYLPVAEKGSVLMIIPPNDKSLVERVKKRNNAVGSVAVVRNGLATLGDRYFILESNSDVFAVDEKEVHRNIIKASLIAPKNSNKEIPNIKALFPYAKKGEVYVRLTELELEKYPYMRDHFVLHKDKLKARSVDKDALWFHYGRSQAIQATGDRKLVINPVISPKQSIVNMRIVPTETLVYSGLFLTVEDKSNISLEKLKEFLGTEDFCNFAKVYGKDMSGGYKSINTNIIKKYRIDL